MEGIAVEIIAKFFASTTDFAKGASMTFFDFAIDSKIKKFKRTIKGALETGGVVLIFERS